MQIIKPGTSINFIGAMRIMGVISSVVVLVSLAIIFVKGFNYGIDFAGGVEMRLEFDKDITIGQVRDAVRSGGLKGAQVMTFVVEGRNVMSVKVKGEQRVIQKISEADPDKDKGTDLPDVAKVILTQMQNSFGDDKVSIVSTDMVGPRVGKDLRQKGLFSILFAMLGILAYIAFRFNFRYSPGAVIALAHDVIIVSGIFVVMQKEISLSIIAALLTIAGYSVNDTVVIFDRIREGHTTHRGKPIREIVSRSLNETLSRTILTSVTTLIVLTGIYFLGSAIIKDFSFAMIVGVLVGTYSSIFVATPVYLFLENYTLNRRMRGRKK
jgi:preprotein translocase subunit SecF